MGADQDTELRLAYSDAGSCRLALGRPGRGGQRVLGEMGNAWRREHCAWSREEGGPSGVCEAYAGHLVFGRFPLVLPTFKAYLGPTHEWPISTGLDRPSRATCIMESSFNSTLVKGLRPTHTSLGNLKTTWSPS